MKENKPSESWHLSRIISCYIPHYRELEKCKISSLKFQNVKYNAPFMPLNTSAIAELHWWLKHLKNANQSLQDIAIDCTIQTDGSTQIGGRWSSLERNHINILELKAILLTLKSYFRHNCNVKHVHILTDTSTALAYITIWEARILFFVMILQNEYGNLHRTEVLGFLQATFLV